MAGIRRKIRRWMRRNGRLDAHSSGFHNLFPNGARLERLATGFRFTEGPVWLPREEALLFSDIPGNRIYRISRNDNLSVFREPSGHANGLTLDHAGRLIACEQGNRRVTATNEDGHPDVVAGSYENRKLNSPNDVVVKSDGSIWFTDPPYGIELTEQEQPAQGVYRVPPGGGAPELVAADFSMPNGLAFSPDEAVLYIDDSSQEKRHIRRFQVIDGVRLEGGEVFHDMNVREPGAPDGMKVDEQGRVWCTGAGGVWVLSHEGEHLGTLIMPEKPSNCAWAGPVRSTLVITAETSVYSIETSVCGIASPILS